MVKEELVKVDVECILQKLNINLWVQFCTYLALNVVSYLFIYLNGTRGRKFWAKSHYSLCSCC